MRTRAEHRDSRRLRVKSAPLSCAIAFGLTVLVGAAWAQDAPSNSPAVETVAEQADSRLRSEVAVSTIHADDNLATQAQKLARVRIVEGTSFDTEVGRPITIPIVVEIPATGQFIHARATGNRFVEPAGNVVQSGENTWSVPVVVFRSGTYDVSGIEVAWIDDKGAEYKASSEAFSIRVQSVIANEEAPTLSAPGPWLHLRTRNVPLIIASALLLAAVLGFLIAQLFRRRESEPEIVQEGPKRPAWEIALESLDTLEAENLLEAGEHVQFHFRLSEIVRTWIDGRYGMNAMEMTTREITQELKRNRLTIGQHGDAIEQILEDTDFVKFARFQPPVEGSRKVFAQTKELILAVRDQDEREPDPVPDPIEGEPETIVEAVASSPQPQEPGTPAVSRASQGPLPQNVITIQSLRSQSSKEDAP